MLIVEQVHYACCPLAHGHQVRGRLVESKQAQGCTLLHTVHAVSVGTAHGSQRPPWTQCTRLPTAAMWSGQDRQAE